MKPAILLLLGLTATAQDHWVLTLPLHWHKAAELTPYVVAGEWRYRHEDAYGPVRIGRTLPDDYWVARDCTRKLEGFISSPMFPARDIASAQIQTECLVVGVDSSKERLMRKAESEIVDCSQPVYPVVRCSACAAELVPHDGSYTHRENVTFHALAESPEQMSRPYFYLPRPRAPRTDCLNAGKHYRLLTPISFELVCEDDAEIKREGDAVVAEVERLVVRE